MTRHQQRVAQVCLAPLDKTSNRPVHSLRQALTRRGVLCSFATVILFTQKSGVGRVIYSLSDVGVQSSKANNRRGWAVVPYLCYSILGNSIECDQCIFSFSNRMPSNQRTLHCDAHTIDSSSDSPFSLNNHSISAICNLPVGPFVGAAREGWGRYFHDLHRKMRARETISAGYKRPQSTRKGRSSAEGTHRPPGRQRRSGQQQPPAPATTYYGNPRRNSADTNLRRTTYTSCNRRPTQDCDSLAESRAPLATRAATENATRRMAIRLQTLWQELKIPKPDRAYVVAAYLNGCGDEGGGTGTAVGCAEAEGWPTSVEVHRELVRQITLLLEYRAATIKVRWVSFTVL